MTLPPQECHESIEKNTDHIKELKNVKAEKLCKIETDIHTSIEGGS